MKISEHNSLKTLNHASSLAHAGALALLALSAFAPNGCRYADEPPPPPLTEGKRDYVWSIDTLLPVGDGIQFFANGIWGTSPSNIYVVGETGNNHGSVRHYDGKQWTTLKVSTAEGGPIPDACEFLAIWGAAANDIWIVGETDGFQSRIVHFDGTHWEDAKIPRRGSLVAVWGSSPNDVWAGGGSVKREGGDLFHYDGVEWKPVSFDTSLYCGAIGGFSSNDVFGLFGRFLHNADSLEDTESHLMHWDGASWSSIDSFSFPSPVWKFGTYLWTDGIRALFTSAYGVFRYDSPGQWRKVLASDYILRVGGSSDFNMFAAGDFGRAYHWNGKDWKPLPMLLGERCYFTAIWTNNIETFLVADDGRNSYVLHGR